MYRSWRPLRLRGFFLLPAEETSEKAAADLDDVIAHIAVAVRVEEAADETRRAGGALLGRFPLAAEEAGETACIEVSLPLALAQHPQDQGSEHGEDLLHLAAVDPGRLADGALHRGFFPGSEIPLHYRPTTVKIITKPTLTEGCDRTSLIRRYFLALEGNMKAKQRRWTFVVVGIWFLAMGLSMVMAPAPSEAVRVTHDVGWMVYTPNHPNGCAPLPYDCYVVFVYPPA